MTATGKRSEYQTLAWSGSKLGLSWIDDPAGTPSGHFRTVSLDGTVDPVFDLGVPGPTEDLGVAWDGASWRIAWSEDTATDREIFRSTDGAPAQAITANGRDDLEVRQVPIAGGNMAYLWTTSGSRNGFDLVLAVLDATGTKLVNDLTIATGLNAVEVQDLVWTGSELVVFYATPSQLVMLRMSPSGSPIAGPIPIATEIVPSDVFARWLGDRFLVTWHGSGIHIAYLSPDGALLSPILQPPMNPLFTLRISPAVGPTSDVVVWDDIAKGSAYLLPVERNGTLGTITEFPQTASITAAWAGTHWVLAASQGQPREIQLIQLCP